MTLISRREAAGWLAAFLLVASVLVAMRFESEDPDSALYAALAERLTELPIDEWIAPSWWGLWDGAGLFREHPAGVLVPTAALARLGVPARQGAYVLGLAYGLASLLVIGAIVTRVASPRDGRLALILLQLMPVAFVFRIRANHEYPMLLCLLVALAGIDGVRRSWRWLPVAPIALTAALLVKGVFVVLIVVAAAIWAVTNPAREPVRWTRVAAAGLASVVLMAATAIAYDAAYYRVTGQTFWGPYWQRQLAPLTIATPFEGGSMLMDHVAFYVTLLAWHPAPWSVALAVALWRSRHGVAARWRALTAGERRGLLFTIGFAVASIVVLSPSSRFAERYAFSATYAVATAGVVAALRVWPWLTRVLTHTDARVPGLPAIVWCTLVLARLLLGEVLPRV